MKKKEVHGFVGVSVCFVQDAILVIDDAHNIII
jgi:hypothetical protein